MKKRFTIGGAVAGLLYSVGFLVYVSMTAPGMLGRYGLMVSVRMVGTSVCGGALGGLLVGWLVRLCVRKK